MENVWIPKRKIRKIFNQYVSIAANCSKSKLTNSIKINHSILEYIQSYVHNNHEKYKRQCLIKICLRNVQSNPLASFKLLNPDRTLTEINFLSNSHNLRSSDQTTVARSRARITGRSVEHNEQCSLEYYKRHRLDPTKFPASRP